MIAEDFLELMPGDEVEYYGSAGYVVRSQTKVRDSNDIFIPCVIFQATGSPVYSVLSVYECHEVFLKKRNRIKGGVGHAKG